MELLRYDCIRNGEELYVNVYFVYMASNALDSKYGGTALYIDHIEQCSIKS
jgi:hypothetical protein